MTTTNRKVAPQDIQPQPPPQHNDFNRSDISIAANLNLKTHLSASVKKSIALIAQKHHSFQESSQKIEREESQLTKLIRAKVKEFRKITVCDICSSQFKMTERYMCDCPHKYSFCQSCLYTYAMYKIKQFEEVYCPAQNCGMVIDTDSCFFKHIPLNLQNTYHKIHRFSLAAKDSSVVKLCPDQKCEGSLRLKQDQGLMCDRCSKQYCAKCYLGKHEGECEQFELNYFQNNLHYRQCRRCKMIVERNKGCNHMTCRCLYQFCYICGEKWSIHHSKLHQQNNEEHQPPPRIHHQSFLLQLVQCCICQQCHQAGCVSFWNSYVGIMVKCMGKLLLLVAEGVILLVQMVLRDIPFLVWMLVCTVLIGMFFTSLQVICESESWHGVVLMVFLPVAMVLGVVRSCGQVFGPAMHQFYNGSITPIMDGFNDIISL